VGQKYTGMWAKSTVSEHSMRGFSQCAEPL
jgi:hypothetical protein